MTESEIAEKWGKIFGIKYSSEMPFMERWARTIDIFRKIREGLKDLSSQYSSRELLRELYTITAELDSGHGFYCEYDESASGGRMHVLAVLEALGIAECKNSQYDEDGVKWGNIILKKEG